ncbi:MAG: aspartate/glutamate racemase family protein, partial [Oscillospiraceae bacterium]|nr:aspartate/glutamate racemase family protein [Oscillospiraceae bacterium]
DNVAFLQRRGVKLIAAACGTVSSNVPKEHLDNLTVPFVDVINPTVIAALKATRTKRIGIIATPATIKANSMGLRLAELDSEVQVIGVACPDFVPLIESGHINDDVIRKSAEGYLAEIRAFGADTLILGCTHYPLISAVIADILGDGVTLIDSGRETAIGIRMTLEKLGLLNERENGGTAEYFVTNNTEAFDGVAKVFLGEEANVNSILKNIED